MLSSGESAGSRSRDLPSLTGIHSDSGAGRPNWNGKIQICRVVLEVAAWKAINFSSGEKTGERWTNFMPGMNPHDQEQNVDGGAKFLDMRITKNENRRYVVKVLRRFRQPAKE